MRVFLIVRFILGIHSGLGLLGCSPIESSIGGLGQDLGKFPFLFLLVVLDLAVHDSFLLSLAVEDEVQKVEDSSDGDIFYFRVENVEHFLL